MVNYSCKPVNLDGVTIYGASGSRVHLLKKVYHLNPKLLYNEFIAKTRYSQLRTGIAFKGGFIISVGKYSGAGIGILQSIP